MSVAMTALARAPIKVLMSSSETASGCGMSCGLISIGTQSSSTSGIIGNPGRDAPPSTSVANFLVSSLPSAAGAS